MPVFSNLRTKHRTVCMVLVVWLFALASGSANACLLQQRSTHWHGPSDHDPLIAQASHVSPGHVGIDPGHEGDAGEGKSACLKVCGDDSQSVIKVASSVDLTDAAMAPALALVWPDQLAVAERDNAWLALPAPSPGVPLRTRFARLAL